MQCCMKAPCDVSSSQWTDRMHWCCSGLFRGDSIHFQSQPFLCTTSSSGGQTFSSHFWKNVIYFVDYSLLKGDVQFDSIHSDHKSTHLKFASFHLEFFLQGYLCIWELCVHSIQQCCVVAENWTNLNLHSGGLWSHRRQGAAQASLWAGTLWD